MVEVTTWRKFEQQRNYRIAAAIEENSAGYREFVKRTAERLARGAEKCRVLTPR